MWNSSHGHLSIFSLWSLICLFFRFICKATTNDKQWTQIEKMGGFTPCLPPWSILFQTSRAPKNNLFSILLSLKSDTGPCFSPFIFILWLICLCSVNPKPLEYLIPTGNKNKKIIQILHIALNFNSNLHTLVFLVCEALSLGLDLASR